MALANDDGKIVTEQLGDKFETFPVRMAFQAGYAQFEDWTSGTTFHCGIGYFHPFGQCKYYMGEFDMAEAAGFPISDLFTEKFSENFCDMGFAIYRLPDGDIYCYDGIFGTLISGQEDVLLNVVCGGTGRYEGARGLLMGTAEGSGGAKELRPGFFLPEGLLKLMEGYIKIPKK